MVVQKEGEALQVSGCKGMLLDNVFILAESDTHTQKETGSDSSGRLLAAEDGSPYLLA